MDHALPPDPPAWRAEPAPARACAPAPFARGDAPGWTLSMCGDHLLLDIAGVMPVRLARPAWRSTPAGRTLTATDPAGRVVSLVVSHGVCRDRRSDSPAVLTIAGRSLRGCMTVGGDRPYDGAG